MQKGVDILESRIMWDNVVEQNVLKKVKIQNCNIIWKGLASILQETRMCKKLSSNKHHLYPDHGGENKVKVDILVSKIV